jgi:hypothetical protein
MIKRKKPKQAPPNIAPDKKGGAGSVVRKSVHDDDIADKRRKIREPQGAESTDSSYLAEETKSMDRNRRELEQEGHRKYARVNARHHEEREQQQAAPEGELQNSILQNPWLDSQRFDGVDPNVNPEPPLNSEARREFDNQRREQEMEKQLRLGNMPKMGSAPKPQGP